MSGTFKAFVILLGLAWAVPAAGQALPRHDISGLFGWSTAKRPRPDIPYDYWIGAWFGTATTGWYWSDHQKTEVTVAGSAERSLQAGYEFIENSSVSYTTKSTTNLLRTQSFSAAQLYQFYRNASVHPFVGAGLEVDRERWRNQTIEQTYERQSPIGLDHLVSSKTTTTEPEFRIKPRVFALAGIKAYFSERTFFRADVRISAGRVFDRFSWRVGGGFDF